jgi:long-chain acyl-CoA synthetase
MSDLSWPLQRAALVHGDAVAVVDGERTLTYGKLARRVGALGAALDDLGIGAGGRVGYLGVNSLAHFECWLAVPAFGRVLVDLNFRLAADELAFMVDDSGVEVLVVDETQLEVGRMLHRRCGGLRQLVVDGPAYEALVAGDEAAPPGVEPETLAAISYTGGTTGTPKGVMLSHGNLLANARHNLIVTGHRPEHRFLHVCPMFHVAGTSNVFACTWVGAAQVILPRFEAAPVLAAIERERITHTALVPTMLAMLLNAPESAGTDLSSLLNVQYAASPISPEVQRRVLERFACEIAQFYGMTEAAPTVSHLSPDDHRRHPDRLRSMGTPVPGVQAEIRSPIGEPLPAGEVGDLWVRGPNVMLGYWNRPEATAEALVDGWYRSGDLVRSDDRGYLYMVDRLKDMIITGAENVYSVEVEAVLLAHDAVAEAAVFGVPHARWGEAVHAVVTARPGATPTAEELIAHCRSRIAGFKLPRAIDVRPDPLPKSGAGKLLKNDLRAPYWEGHERRVN